MVEILIFRKRFLSNFDHSLNLYHIQLSSMIMVSRAKTVNTRMIVGMPRVVISLAVLGGCVIVTIVTRHFLICRTVLIVSDHSVRLNTVMTVLSDQSSHTVSLSSIVTTAVTVHLASISRDAGTAMDVQI